MTAETDPWVGRLLDALPEDQRTAWLDTGHPGLDGDTPRFRVERGCQACRYSVIELLTAMKERSDEVTA